MPSFLFFAGIALAIFAGNFFIAEHSGSKKAVSEAAKKIPSVEWSYNKVRRIVNGEE